MSHGESIAALTGRVVLAWFYLALTWRYAADRSATTILLSMKDVPQPDLSLLLGLIVNCLGSVSILVGFHTRAGALGLFLVTIASTLAVYDYWTVAAPIAREAEFDLFARNIAVAGGLLLLMGTGPGRFALDNLPEHRRHSAAAMH